MDIREQFNQMLDRQIASGQQRYQIPEELRNDPKAMVMHLINSGQVAPPMLQRIMPMVRQLMGK